MSERRPPSKSAFPDHDGSGSTGNMSRRTGFLWMQRPFANKEGYSVPFFFRQPGWLRHFAGSSFSDRDSKHLNETSMPHASHPSTNSESPPRTTVESDHPVQKMNIAWLQLRMGWPTVGKIRLDQEKKDSIAAIISHYQQTEVPDRARAEFDQVLQRLEEEHVMRLRELVKEQRRAAKQQNNPIQIIQETNASKVRKRIELTEETPPLIDEWKQLIVRLF